jgi:hypothetical protein
MQIELIWKKTQDRLLFEAINSDVAEWFVDTSQRLGNNYAIADQKTDGPRRSHDTEKLISEITHDINQVNKFFISMRQPVISIPDDWCNQIQLNKLHKDWAHTRKAWPRLPNMLHKLDRLLFDNYQEMNCHIHLIEHSFRYEFRDSSNWRVDNIFKDNMYEWEVCNLSISYPGHGRNAFEKFENLDDDLADIEIDNCNWDNIDAFLSVNLGRPYKLTPPTEFLDWCQEKKLVPHTHTLPMANLADWRNTITQARKIFMSNVKIPDNHFSLSIIK